ncbi:hypothetical protein [Mycolicibacterium madagascariense]|uniref:hypothetical protein n=1 Tax=Mycolicibacterium madagascariense TaxID=212765 RepID=UPI0013D448AB|nr:hypothetical protein [Mycolicibacterium madagascariense]MCV7014469.1 hypothetical protein [Mycolicibacterium madagascariense]
MDLETGDITAPHNSAVVKGRLRKENGGKTKNADHTISTDRVTVGPFGSKEEIRTQARTMHSHAAAALKAGVNPRVVGDRIGHATMVLLGDPSQRRVKDAPQRGGQRRLCALQV